MEFGFVIGLLIGALAWWSAYEPGAGLFQNVQLIIVPAAFGIFVVSLRNRRKRVGPYDPEVVARNKDGVV
ncbi:hypothetical protein [Altererythrobacter fulvus]|uniref:hypothetical protein n=1 Tax=Caenibius fulvus TaxID=2126012 RepID=UPI00301813C2